jgi:hypothetical protein
MTTSQTIAKLHNRHLQRQRGKTFMFLERKTFSKSSLLGFFCPCRIIRGSHKVDKFVVDIVPARKKRKNNQGVTSAPTFGDTTDFFKSGN